MNPKIDLLASYWTIAGGALPHTDHEYSPFDFRDRAETASKAGFTGMGLWHADLEHILRKRTLREVKQILDDNGIRHIELEFLTDWFLDGERKKASDSRKRQLLDAAAVLGARHIKVGDFVKQPYSLSKVVESFAALCADAAQHATRVGFELMPFAMIDTLGESLAMIRAARAENGGIVLDLWHLAKLGIAYEMVEKIPLEYVVGVELNDGTFEAPWSLHEDTINHRRFCGEGEFDVKGFVATLTRMGYQGPWGIEILSEQLRKMTLDEVTRRSFATTVQQFHI